MVKKDDTFLNAVKDVRPLKIKSETLQLEIKKSQNLFQRN